MRRSPFPCAATPVCGGATSGLLGLSTMGNNGGLRVGQGVKASEIWRLEKANGVMAGGTRLGG